MVHINTILARPCPLLTHYVGTVLSATRISEYVSAIFDPTSKSLPRMECPTLNETRYAPLRELPGVNTTTSGQVEYFFALDLRNCLSLLPRLLGSVVEAINFLGPHRCALSIVEGNSPDGTADVLVALKPFLEHFDIPYYYQSSTLNPKKGNRIEKLAKLRNLALEPLFANERVSSQSTVLFVNDVAACPEDLLELALQRRVLGADMTCGMDWAFVGPDPTFYDVWISRGINGDTFFKIPLSGSWDFAWDLFWNDPKSKARLLAGQPFQVYSCWNGAAAFTAAPLLGPDGLRFRASSKGHCQHGEPQNFCKDLWQRGHGKIAVVPTVNLEYTNEKGARIKSLIGYTSGLIRELGDAGAAIEWAGPPEKVRCVESWGNQFWKPWKVSRRQSG